MTALSILYHMLKNADRVRPWPAEELAKAAGAPVSSAYRHLRAMARKDIVRHVVGGYVLSPLVLNAAGLYNAALLQLKHNPEELYGKAKRNNQAARN